MELLGHKTIRQIGEFSGDLAGAGFHGLISNTQIDVSMERSFLVQELIAQPAQIGWRNL